MKFYKIRDSVMFNNGKIVIFDCGAYIYFQDSASRVIIGRKQDMLPSSTECKPFDLDVMVRTDNIVGGNFSGTALQAMIYFVFNYNMKRTNSTENFWRTIYDLSK